MASKQVEKSQGLDGTSRDPAQARAIFQVEGLTKVFGRGDQELRALQDIDLQVKQGEIFGIIGLSGAGKSTLIRCLNLLERPTSGRVLFRGEDLASLDPAELRRRRQKIGMIFQNFNLLNQRTSLENIRFPLELAGQDKDLAEARAKELLDLVGLSDKANSYPSQLSGGQKQRVAIARALANQPDVLLCDEATSALDPATTQSILDLIKQINHKLGLTIVLITHEMAVVQAICHRVAVIDRSRIAELGPVEEVFRKPASQVAKDLILPRGELLKRLQGDRYLRVVFDGTSAHEPIIANMVLALQKPVNILSADSRNIDGIAYGQMIIQIPADREIERNILTYLDSRKVTYEELAGDLAQLAQVRQAGINVSPAGLQGGI